VKVPPRFSAWAAVPDGITALMFATVWFFPFVFGALSVKTAMLTMLVEFFLIHATGFFTAIANQPKSERKLRVRGILGLSTFYVLMIGVFSLAFGEWWPLLAFAWLVVGKLAWIRRSDAGDDAMMWKMAAWAGSVAAYLFAVAITAMLPLPRFGMSADKVPLFGFGEEMSGSWVEEPHTVVAMGVLYFSLLCAAKLLAARWQSRRALEVGIRNLNTDKSG